MPASIHHPMLDPLTAGDTAKDAHRIHECRLCRATALVAVLELGEQALTGKGDAELRWVTTEQETVQP
jgi:hypothetical protein